MTTCACSLASPPAIARPIPFAPPVTIATLPSSAPTALAVGGSDAANGHVLELQPLVDAVLRALAADAGLLDAAERRHLGRDEAGVDADDSVLERLRDAPDARVRSGVEVGGQAVRGVVGDPHRLVLRLEARDPCHGSEGLLAAHRHVPRDPGEHRRLEELALQAAP